MHAPLHSSFFIASCCTSRMNNNNYYYYYDGQRNVTLYLRTSGHEFQTLYLHLDKFMEMNKLLEKTVVSICSRMVSICSRMVSIASRMVSTANRASDLVNLIGQYHLAIL